LLKALEHPEVNRPPDTEIHEERVENIPENASSKHSSISKSSLESVILPLPNITATNEIIDHHGQESVLIQDEQPPANDQPVPTLQEMAERLQAESLQAESLQSMANHSNI